MKETYYLNKDTLPVMPTPHDNIISSITVDDEFVTFILETDPEDKDDSIQYYKPGAKELIIRYHTERDYLIYQHKKTKRPSFLCKMFTPRIHYIDVDENKLEALALAHDTYSLDYIEHFVGYNTVIVFLYSESSIYLRIQADYVEYEWIV